jgi:hypothetical protein
MGAIKITLIVFFALIDFMEMFPFWKMMVTHMVKKFLIFNCTGSLITIFKKADGWIGLQYKMSEL